MTEEDKKLMLLQEEYCVIRTKVRDAYEQYRAIVLQINMDRACLEDMQSDLIEDSAGESAEDIKIRISENEDLLKTIRDSLPYLSSEMDRIEEQLGEKNELYGRDDGWWIRS